MTLDPRKQGIVQTYELASATYDGPWLPFWAASARALVAGAGIEPGESVLDVGTGTGEVALAAASAVGAEGRVVGIDLSDGMLARARRRAEALGLSQVRLLRHDFEHVDALASDGGEAGGPFDVAISSFTLFFAADMAALLGKLRASLRRSPDGRPGRIAVAAPGDRAFQPHSDLLMQGLARRGVEVPKQLSWQRIPDAAALAGLLEGAGFTDVRLESVQLGYAIPGPGAWWDIVWGSGFRGPVEKLEPSLRDAFRKEHLEEISRLGAPGRFIELTTHFAFAHT